MFKKGTKRKSSVDEVGLGGSPRKKLPVASHVAKSLTNDDGHVASEQVVKEFIKMVNIKQTRLKGLTRFLKTLKESGMSSREIILMYLQKHPDCLEMFQVLDERIEERSLFEVQVVLEILETIILHLAAEEDTSAKSKSTAIITTIFTRYRKLVYNSLNPSSPARLVAAMLKLLTAVVMQGSSVAKEMLTTFDFSHKTFGILVNRRDKKVVSDVRTCYIKFLMSFFVAGDPSLIQQVLQIKGFATSIFKNLHTDPTEVIHLVLTTLLVKVVQNSSILKKTKILLFTSYSLTQLVSLYSYNQESSAGDEMSVRDKIHQFLLELCTSRCGIAFENKLGMFSTRSNNPVLLRFLHSLPKTLRDDLLVELVLKILLHSQDLVTPYLSDCQMALEPRNSEQWANNFLFLIKLYFLLPLPSSTVDKPAVSLERTSLSKLLLLVCPVIVKRNILTRGLLHSDVLVQTTTLSMLLVILRRCVDLTRCLSVEHEVLATFREDILKVLPSLQILISIRESLASKTRTKEKQDPEKDSPVVMSVESAKSLLSRTLAVMHLYQVLSPNCFSQDGYDPWKILPRTEDEEALYNPSSQHSMLQILLSSPARAFKWHQQGKGEGFLGFHQILQLYCNTKDDGSRTLCREVLKKLLYGTGVFDVNKEEISIWLRNITDDCLEKSETVLKFFKNACCTLANDPYDLVDIVMEAVNDAACVLTTQEPRPPELESVGKSSMPFSPLVAGALKLFSQLISLTFFATFQSSDEKQKEQMTDHIEFVGRFLNLVLLDLLSRQRDPRPLCNIIVKYLVQDDLVEPSLVPAHTKALLQYVMQWCPAVTRKSARKKQDNSDGAKSSVLLSTSKRSGKELPGTILSLLSIGENGDIGTMGAYLRCNPVSLFDNLSSKEFIEALNGLPCYLILQQFLMFESKYWGSGTDIADSAGMWATFEQLSTALLSSAKHEDVELLDRTVSGCLFLVNNLILAYLKESTNERTFLEINRTIVEVLRTVFQRLKEKKHRNDDPGSSSDVTPNETTGDEKCGDVIGHIDVVGHCDVIKHGDVIGRDDVLSVVDVASQSEEGFEKCEGAFSECLKMVFGHHVFKAWFCFDIVKATREKRGASRHVTAVMSSCVADLMSDLRTDILDDKDREFWEPYFRQIAHAVKQRITCENDTVTSLLKLFHDRFPASVMSEAILTFLDLPRDQFVEAFPIDVDRANGYQNNKLTDTGKTFVSLLDCFLNSKVKNSPQTCISSDALERIFELLTWLDCRETDELLVKSVTIFSGVSSEINASLLRNCLDHPTPARVETAVMLMCNQSSLIKHFERRLADSRKRRRKEANSTVENELQFIELASRWIIFLPLMNFYLLSLTRGDAAATSKRSKKCVDYISDVSWPMLKTWLLAKKSQKHASECFQLTSCLLDVQELENDALQTLFKDVTHREHSLSWDMYQVQAVESLLQSILKQSSNERKQMKYRSAFIFACMERLTELLKNHLLQGEESLRLAILCYLEDHGKFPLKLKTNKNFTSEAFMEATNTFIKTILRFCFSCGRTMSVLSVLVKTIYESDCKRASLLTPLSDLYQFILSHSKFLEIFLGNSENAKQNAVEAKCALVDLLQTVVDLEPKCCNPSHLSLVLGAYSAKRGLTDQRLLRLLFTYESYIGELASGSRVLWGEAAIESYKANREGLATLWNQPSIVEVLDLLDSKLLLQSAKHFPIYQQLQPVVCKCTDEESQFYDPSFLLPLFSYFMAPGYEVNCRKFVDRAALAYTICALTSTDQRMRQAAYQTLSRFLVHLSASRFKEKQQVSHLLHCFQNGIMEANARISSLITSFMARALHIFFYPEDPLYVSVNSYLLQKAFMDLREVPLFLSLINSGNLEYRSERTWLLHLLMDGLRDPMDYYICKKYHVFQQLFSLYSCSIADKYLQKLILKVLQQVCRQHAPAYDLCHTYGLVPWLHLLVTNQSTAQDALELVLDILGLIWFTLIGQEVSRDDKGNTWSRRGDVDVKAESKGHVPLPKHICSQLLLVCLSILQRNASLEVWNEDTFVAFVRLLASLLTHQDNVPCTQAKVMIRKAHAAQITRIWNFMFGDVDVLDKLIDLLNRDRFSKKRDICCGKWFLSMRSVVRILNRSTFGGLAAVNVDNTMPLYACLPRPVGKCIEVSLETDLRCTLRIFTEPADVWDDGSYDGFCHGRALTALEDLIF